MVSGGLSTDPIGGIEVNDLFGARSREWSASWQCESEIGRCLWRVGHRRGEGERLPGEKNCLPVCAQAFAWGEGERFAWGNKSPPSPAPSFLVVIVIITRMAVAVIITIILLSIMSSLPPSSA